MSHISSALKRILTQPSSMHSQLWNTFLHNHVPYMLSFETSSYTAMYNISSTLKHFPAQPCSIYAQLWNAFLAQPCSIYAQLWNAFHHNHVLRMISFETLSNTAMYNICSTLKHFPTQPCPMCAQLWNAFLAQPCSIYAQLWNAFLAQPCSSLHADPFWF